MAVLFKKQLEAMGSGTLPVLVQYYITDNNGGQEPAVGTVIQSGSYFVNGLSVIDKPGTVNRHSHWNRFMLGPYSSAKNYIDLRWYWDGWDVGLSSGSCGYPWAIKYVNCWGVPGIQFLRVFDDGTLVGEDEEFSYNYDYFPTDTETNFTLGLFFSMNGEAQIRAFDACFDSCLMPWIAVSFSESTESISNNFDGQEIWCQGNFLTAFASRASYSLDLSGKPMIYASTVTSFTSLPMWAEDHKIKISPGLFPKLLVDIGMAD